MSSSFPNVDPELINVAQYLQSKASTLKSGEAVMAERRVQAFKGTFIIPFIIILFRC